jgi:hypothetical protein
MEIQPIQSVYQNVYRSPPKPETMEIQPIQSVYQNVYRLQPKPSTMKIQQRFQAMESPHTFLYFSGSLSSNLFGEIQSWVLKDEPMNMIIMQEKVQLPVSSLFSICVEYSALISGLRYCLSRQFDTISIQCSSDMIFQQLRGNQMQYLLSVSYASKQLLVTTFELLRKFKYYNLVYIHNEENISKFI